MASTEERLAKLESRMNEQTLGTGNLSIQITSLGEKLGQQFEELRTEFRSDLKELRNDLSDRINTVDQKLDRRVDALDPKVDRVMAFQMAMLLGIVGTLITAVLKHWP